MPCYTLTDASVVRISQLLKTLSHASTMRHSLENFTLSGFMFVSKDQPRQHEIQSSNVVLVFQMNELHVTYGSHHCPAGKHLFLLWSCHTTLLWMEEHGIFHQLYQKCFSFWEKAILLVVITRSQNSYSEIHVKMSSVKYLCSLNI